MGIPAPLGSAIRKLRSRRRELENAWTTAREAFWLALEALYTHKLRSFLTLLGVVIATTTLIVVMSVINGMNLYIANHVANLGANVFIISKYNWASSAEDWLKARQRNRDIQMDEYALLKSHLAGYKHIGATADLNNVTAKYGGEPVYDIELDGVTPSMIDIGQQQVDSGRYISESDYLHSAAVCFIGQDLVDHFFPTLDPLGKEILVNGRPFRVIGVARRIGTTFGQTQDNFIHIPLTTFKKMFKARPGPDVHIQAWSSAEMLPLEDEARTILRVHRHIPYSQTDNFGVNASATIMNLWQELTGSIFAVTIGVVAVFMVVGGIVIMNIMLASVTERTHEIGIRKSLGARRRDILMQFVIESAVMAAAGGLIGVIVAVLISRIINIFFASSVPVTAVIVGLALSASVGLFFGIYPANKAARLDPIEALRTEG